MQQLQIGKLYRSNETNDILALNEQQLKVKLQYIVRMERFYSLGTATFSGKFDMTVLKPNTVILLLDIQYDLIAGIKYTILKCLIADTILYLPFSKQRKPEKYLSLIDCV